MISPKNTTGKCISFYLFFVAKIKKIAPVQRKTRSYGDLLFLFL